VLFSAIDEAQAAIARVRLAAVLELRAQCWSLDQIARATDLSKARAAQLARDPDDRGSPSASEPGRPSATSRPSLD